VTDCGVGRLCCAVQLQPRSSHCHPLDSPLRSLSPITLHSSPTLIVVEHSNNSILSHFHPYITPSHHGKGQTCSDESQCCHLRPAAIVLIVVSSGSTDCGKLFQQVCLHRIFFFGCQPKPFCHFSSPSYPTQRSGNDGGYPRRQNPYAQQEDNASYEMSDVVNPSTAHLTSNMAGDTMATFYDEVRLLVQMNVYLC
jgi:hypothetical protein